MVGKKNILIITQKVDRNDDVLGFFHSWLIEFSKSFNTVTVVALGVGDYELPKNIKVFSLGKEKNKSRLMYILNFYYFIWKEQKKYDMVFVHMNQEYIILGSFLWKILGKKILFWRNHKHGNFITRVAVYFSNRVYYTSPQSYTSVFSHAKQMPVGISLNKKLKSFEKNNSILFLGRISPVKRLDIFIDSMYVLNFKNIKYRSLIVGSPTNNQDKLYEEKMHEKSKELVSLGLVKFLPGVPHKDIQLFFNNNSFFVNITGNGSLDKTILEAMAEGSIVITSNIFFKDLIVPECFLDNVEPEYIANKIESLFNTPIDVLIEWRERHRQYVEKNHDIAILVERVCNEI